MTNRSGKSGKSVRLIYLDFKITVDGDCSYEMKRCCLLGRKAVTNLNCIIKQRHHFADKGPSSQSCGFSSGHVQMWMLDHKESWVLKNWCFWIMVLEKTLESPLDSKEIKSVYPKGNQSWYSLEELILKLMLQYFGYLIGRANSLEKSPMLGKTESNRSSGRQRMRWLNGITN